MIVVRIFPDDAARIRAIAQDWKAATDGSLWRRKERGQLLLLPEEFQTLFAPERMRLLLSLKEEPHTIGELAKRLSRKFAAVHRDLRLLEGYGLVSLEKHGRTVQPRLNEIRLPVIA